MVWAGFVNGDASDPATGNQIACVWISPFVAFTVRRVEGIPGNAFYRHALQDTARAVNGQ
jgi:hypothetical protein